MANKVWIYIDQFKGEAHPGSWEGLGAGRDLADQLESGVTALVFGPQADGVAGDAFQYGADEVLFADDATFEEYRPEPFTSLISKLAQESAPEVILFPTTTRGRELAAMSAIDLDTGILPDVVALEVADGRVVATRPVYAGKLLSKVVCTKQPQIVTTRTRAFTSPEPDTSRSGVPTKVEAVVPEEN
ncbi:MAG: hypothetical protein PVF74_06300, partial [Anaerolineales bacterium]